MTRLLHFFNYDPFWLLILLLVGLSGQTLTAQNGPDCDTYTTRTTSGLGSNIVNEVFVLGTTVYAATNLGLSISTNGGTSFTNKTTEDGLGSDIVYGVYAAGSTVYAATSNGLSISTNGGTSSTNKTTANGLGSNVVTDVFAVGTTVYAATTGGLSISTDGGTSFITRTTANGLGNNSVLGVYVAGTTVYVATMRGISFCTADPLPISLIVFTASPQPGHRVALAWATALETDNSGFLIERSKDMRVFETVGEVGERGPNNSARQDYQLTDQLPFRGTSYYRLTQIDLSGKRTVYRAVSVVLRAEAYGVYPNPVISDGRFTLRLDEPETAKVGFYSTDGRSLPLQKAGVESGNLVLRTIGKLSTGVYVLRVEERGQIRQHRILIH